MATINLNDFEKYLLDILDTQNEYISTSTTEIITPTTSTIETLYSTYSVISDYWIIGTQKPNKKNKKKRLHNYE